MKTMALVIPQAMPRYPNRIEPVKVAAPAQTVFEKAVQWAVSFLHNTDGGMLSKAALVMPIAAMIIVTF